jgi:hypothetical protein
LKQNFGVHVSYFFIVHFINVLSFISCFWLHCVVNLETCENKHGNKTYMLYSLIIIWVCSFSTHCMTILKPLKYGSNILNMLWALCSKKRQHEWKEGHYNFAICFCICCHNTWSFASKSEVSKELGPKYCTNCVWMMREITIANALNNN